MRITASVSAKIARALEQGESVEDVALRFGQTVERINDFAPKAKPKKRRQATPKTIDEALGAE